MSLLLLALAGCSNGDPETSDLFHAVQIQVPTTAAEADAFFVDLADSATTTLDVALPALETTTITDALVAAHDRGVEVAVVTDFDRQDDPGVAALIEAGIPLTLADDGITYFDFNIKRDVAWTSEQTIMSHAFAIADSARAVAATSAGVDGPGSRVVLEIRGEDLVADLGIEHNQVFGGTDATATTAFDSAAKSIADFRWSYPTTSDHRLELWLGPQERLTKRIIDATYKAKSSVWVLTDDFVNEGLLAALQAKGAHGFDVRLVTGPNLDGRNDPNLFRFYQGLRNDTPEVDKHRICDPVVVPTVVLIDYEPARNGVQYTSRAFVLSHDLYSAARLYNSTEVVNDQLIDGNLWVFDDYDAPSGPMEVLQGVFEDHLSRATGGLQCP